VPARSLAASDPGAARSLPANAGDMADVLIVDDSVDIAEILEALMLAEGHRVRLAFNGQAGLSAIDERLPELVLMDIDMPVVDGPGMAYRMLVEDCGRETIPIVIVSGSPDLPRIGDAVGTPYVLAKPFDPEALVALTARALEERTPPTPRP
jgi:DNA-binding NtrC family response regulator